MISVFDLFKVGIGPSSSHTVGPMIAGHRFCNALKGQVVDRMHVDIYGSLALTGKGHCTDTAVMLGLAGFLPDSINPDEITPYVQSIYRTHQLPSTFGLIPFDPQRDIVFHSQALPLHENGLSFHAYRNGQRVQTQTYYSVGGGFVVCEEDFGSHKSQHGHAVPHDFKSASQLLAICSERLLSIADLVLANESQIHGSPQAIADYFAHIWRVMQQCIHRGIHTTGHLPGALRTARRAAPLYEALTSSVDKESNDPLDVLDWVNLFAMAVNEENACGGRIVTAPTNGASGIVPAVLMYHHRFVKPLEERSLLDFFLTAGAMGMLYKMNASISGAEVGCQGEVGVACSMAAGGLTALLGGSPEQVCIAAEIAMEHNLGLTCDPVGGLVQIPCIERNAIAATKAINAARMALKRCGTPSVSLDAVIATMLQTGKDIHLKYRETSLGGLAITVRC